MCLSTFFFPTTGDVVSVNHWQAHRPEADDQIPEGTSTDETTGEKRKTITAGLDALRSTGRPVAFMCVARPGCDDLDLDLDRGRGHRAAQ